ncbi:SSPO protein, partial [Podargus strigoides]|nr:SSPO protein [Podargus strigoides]
GQGWTASTGDIPVSPPAMPCPEGQQYQDCTHPCTQTCPALRGDSATPCPAPPHLCVPGCACPQGLLRAPGDHCVPP